MPLIHTPLPEEIYKKKEISEDCRTEDQIFWGGVAKKQKFLKAIWCEGQIFWGISVHRWIFLRALREKKHSEGKGNFKVLHQSRVCILNAMVLTCVSLGKNFDCGVASAWEELAALLPKIFSKLAQVTGWGYPGIVHDVLFFPENNYLYPLHHPGNSNVASYFPSYFPSKTPLPPWIFW